MTSGIFSKWPGLSEMRACYCSRFRPADGLEVCSLIYPGGFPRDPAVKQPQQLESPEPRQVAAGQTAGVDPGLAGLLAKVAKNTQLPRVYGSPVPSDVKRGESELHALERIMRELPRPAAPPIRPATSDEIAAIRAVQLARAEKAETRAILAALEAPFVSSGREVFHEKQRFILRT